MEAYAAKLTERYLGERPLSVTSLGGGFYGRVFLAELNRAPYKAVVKIYLFKGLGCGESEQLQVLSRHSSIRMPKVYCLHDADDEIPADALIMEYIEGLNLGNMADILPADGERIADQVINNLIGYHSVIHPEGFGQINGTEYDADWRDYYRPKAEAGYRKAVQMHGEGKLDNDVLRVVQKAYEHFDGIFSQPVEHARLIHGDYNTWNVLINKEATAAVAVIDPFNCCWGDSEFDLYQLNNANGSCFHLLEKYIARVKMSSNFEIKMSFYELFTEITHFFDAGIDTARSNIPGQAEQMEKKMREYGF